jgi:hypothetical protein
MDGCLKRLGCLALIVIVGAIAWVTRERWLPWVEPHRGTAARATTRAPVTWEPLTPEGAARAKETIQRLSHRSGPVFANLRPGDLTAYIFQELSNRLPASAEHIEAAVIGERLEVRADVKLSDLADPRTLGPLASVLGDRAPIQFGGTLDVVKPGLGEYRVETLRIRDLAIPKPMIPRLLRHLERGPRPDGLADNALPLVIPVHIADVRIHDGKITLYKAVS